MGSEEVNIFECRYMTTMEASEYLLENRVNIRQGSMGWSLSQIIVLTKLAWRKPQLNSLIISLLEDIPVVGSIFKLFVFVDVSKFSQKVSLEDLIYIMNLTYQVSGKSIVSDAELLDLPPTLAKMMAKVKGKAVHYDVSAYACEIVSYSGLRDFGNKNSETYLRLLTLMLASCDAGRHKQAFYFASEMCKALFESLSFRELSAVLNAVMPRLIDIHDSHRPQDGLVHQYFINIQELHAKVLFSLGEYKPALEVYVLLANKANRMPIQLEAKRKVVRCLERLGNHQVEEAVAQGEHYLVDSAGDLYAKAKLLRTLGWSQVSLGKAKEALDFSTQAKSLFLKIGQAKKDHFLQPMDVDIVYNLARTYNNIGAAYELLGQYKKAIYFHLLCMKTMKKSSRKWYSGSLLNLSIVFRKERKFTKSMQYADEAKNIKNAICDYDDLPPVLYNYAFSCILYYLHAKKEKRSGMFSFFAKEGQTKQLHAAGQMIEEAILIRQEQGSGKRVVALHCLGALVQLFLPSDGKLDFISYFHNSENLSNIQYEKDKVPLMHKVVAIINMVQGNICTIACDKDEVSKESELGCIKDIMIAIKESDV